MDNVAQKIYFGMDVSDKFVEIFALTPDSAQNQRMKIENNRESLSYFCQNIPDKKTVAVAMENGTHSPFFGTETLSQLSDDGFNQTPLIIQGFDLLGGPIVFHVGAQGCVQ